MTIGETFWNNKYKINSTGWDLGEISPPLKAYIDQITEKNLRILIPGCGNSYEAEYLLQKGFNNITIVDIAPLLVEKLKQKFALIPQIKIICGNFFQHIGEYDLILEQTFFCAINPEMRSSYIAKMVQLLAPEGRLAGVLFDREFENEGPPFGGSKTQYIPLYENSFSFKVFESCYNSFAKRQGTELFIILIKKQLL